MGDQERARDQEAELVHDRAAGRFELRLDGRAVSVADYETVAGSWALVHTETRPDLGGRGLAARVVRFALDTARREGRSVLPECSYVVAYLRHHPEDRDLVPEDRRSAL